MLLTTKRFIYNREGWPNFTWDNESLLDPLGIVRGMQGRLVGKMEALGFELRGEASLESLVMDVLKSSEIEGEILDMAQVRSSLARRLGMDIAGAVPSDRNVDGVVEMMLDATQQFEQPLTPDRLFGWHAALFPSGRSGLHKILVGQWRDDALGPMQVVSGAMGKEKVHFQAPDAAKVAAEMETFLEWVNQDKGLDPVIKAGVAHLWFLTIHPFDDGNGRIARALTDLLLARADGTKQRYYSMSSQIRLERATYYDLLERSQSSSLDITMWLQWFLNCLGGALTASEALLGKVLFKHDFWQNPATMGVNVRQHLMLNKLMDGFEGKLNSSKWAKIAKCSQDTALRDIQDLVDRGLLLKAEGGGRSTSYELANLQGNLPRN